VRILLRAVERCLRAHSPGCSAAARLGAVVFIHRFGSALNAHLHFHCCISDGVFAAAGAADGTAGVVFHAASGLDEATVATVPAQVRQRVLRAFVRRGLLDRRDGDAMGGWAHRAAARYLWAMLLARIYEVSPLTCPFCHGSMRIIAFVNDPGAVRQVLAHLGEPTRPPRIAPARGPPLWEAVAAATAADHDPRWDPSVPPLPEIEFDQRLTW